jgi:hypothetical protein
MYMCIYVYIICVYMYKSQLNCMCSGISVAGNWTLAGEVNMKVEGSASIGEYAPVAARLSHAKKPLARQHSRTSTRRCPTEHERHQLVAAGQCLDGGQRLVSHRLCTTRMHARTHDLTQRRTSQESASSHQEPGGSNAVSLTSRRQAAEPPVRHSPSTTSPRAPYGGEKYLGPTSASTFFAGVRFSQNTQEWQQVSGITITVPGPESCGAPVPPISPQHTHTAQHDTQQCKHHHPWLMPIIRGLLHSGVDLGVAGPSVWKQNGPTPTLSATGQNSSGTTPALLEQ